MNWKSVHRGQEELACGLLITVVVLLLIVGGCWGIPHWRVFANRLEGEAEFARAEQNRRIKIEEAKANLEAERMNAEAEVERAKGAAKAIEIENGKLTSTYIQYLWVRQQSGCNNKIIYIPTEACMPIMEATRNRDDK